MTDQKKFEEKLELSVKDIIEKGTSPVNNMMAPEFLGCNVKEMWAEFKFKVMDWEHNIAGTLHGGVAAIMFDFSMGVLTRNIVELDFMPTVELNITFLKPVSKDDTVIVRAQIEKIGSRIIHLSGDMLIEESGKRAAMARGMFLNGSK